MFGFGRKKILFISTYVKVLEELAYKVKTFSLSDQIAATLARKAMAACTGYKMAIAHCEENLENADLDPKKAGDWRQEFKGYSTTTKEGAVKIDTVFNDMRQKAAELPDNVQREIAVELALMEESSDQAASQEADISAQLLAEAEDPKQKAKQERLAQKQQAKEVGQATKDFLKTAQGNIEKLENEIDVGGMKKQTETLERKVVPLLEEQAKVVVEAKPVIKEVPAGAALTNSQLQEEIGRQRGRGG